MVKAGRVAELVETRCAFCGGLPAEILGEKNGYRVGRCLMCGLWRTLERDPDYGRIYEHAEYHNEHQLAEGHVPYANRFSHDFVVAESRYDKLMQHHRSLDVGCANGAFVRVMRAKGWQAEGLEVNVAMANLAIRETECPIHVDWSTVIGPYDLITYHDVFEHIADPVEELKRVHDFLRPEGMLVLDVPDADDPRFASLGLEWHHCRPEQHLYYWDEPHLGGLMKFCGFEIVSTDRPIPGKLVMYGRRVSDRQHARRKQPTFYLRVPDAKV